MALGRRQGFVFEGRETLQCLPRTEDEDLLLDLERKFEARLTFRTDPQGSLEKFTVLDATTNQEVR